MPDERVRTLDWHVGNPPDERATATARARGIVLEGAARVVRREDFADFDCPVWGWRSE